MGNNIIAEKSYEFAIQSVTLYKDLIARREFVLSKQFLKSSTSVGANIEEALGAISRKDFRAKLSISYKEARETKYWLRLLKDTQFLSEKEYSIMYAQLEEILRLLYRIIKSTT